MKYFTAELYEQSKSLGAEAFDSLMSQARAQYRARLEEIWPSLLPQIKALASKYRPDSESELFLHNAEFVFYAPTSIRSTMIEVRQYNEFYHFRYHLTAPMVVGPPRPSHAFSDAGPDRPAGVGGRQFSRGTRWLYDEVDMLKLGEYSHHILLSNGQEIGLLFDDVRVDLENFR